MHKKSLTATKVRYRVLDKHGCVLLRCAKKKIAFRLARKTKLLEVVDTMAKIGSPLVWRIDYYGNLLCVQRRTK